MADKLEMMSSNVIQENIDYIAEKFPNALKEVMEDGKLVKKIDFDVLKQELSTLNTAREEYKKQVNKYNDWVNQLNSIESNINSCTKKLNSITIVKPTESYEDYEKELDTILTNLSNCSKAISTYKIDKAGYENKITENTTLYAHYVEPTKYQITFKVERNKYYFDVPEGVVPSPDGIDLKKHYDNSCESGNNHVDVIVVDSLYCLCYNPGSIKKIVLDNL